jgi:hypothetical protein
MLLHEVLAHFDHICLRYRHQKVIFLFIKDLKFALDKLTKGKHIEIIRFLILHLSIFLLLFEFDILGF